jgi:hypothetical protein
LNTQKEEKSNGALWYLNLEFYMINDRQTTNKENNSQFTLKYSRTPHVHDTPPVGHKLKLSLILSKVCIVKFSKKGKKKREKITPFIKTTP